MIIYLLNKIVNSYYVSTGDTAQGKKTKTSLRPKKKKKKRSDKYDIK